MKIFVSYSRRDAGDFANQIQRHLSTFKYCIFTDVDSIRAGEIWSNTIEENISSCDIFVVIVTHGALYSPHVEREVLQAQKEKKTIIPCFHRTVIDSDIKLGLNKIQGVEFDDRHELARKLHSEIVNTIRKNENKSLYKDNEGKKNSELQGEKVAVYIDKKDKLPFTKKDKYSKIFFKKIPNLHSKIIVIPIIVVVVILGLIVSINYFNGTSPSDNTGVVSNIQELKDVKSINNKGLALNDLGKYQEAIEYYDKALAINPTYLQALHNKGLALFNQGKYQEAIEWFDKALKVNPNYKYALNGKGSALNGLGNYQEANEWLDKALIVDPNYKYALDNKGKALYNQGNYQEAIEYYDRALSIDPDFSSAQNNKKLAFERLSTDQQQQQTIINISRNI